MTKYMLEISRKAVFSESKKQRQTTRGGWGALGYKGGLGWGEVIYRWGSLGYKGGGEKLKFRVLSGAGTVSIREATFSRLPLVDSIWVAVKSTKIATS